MVEVMRAYLRDALKEPIPAWPSALKTGYSRDLKEPIADRADPTVDLTWRISEDV